MNKYIFISLFFVACASTPPEEQVIVQPPVTQTCVNICNHVKALGCPEGEDINPPEWNPDAPVITCAEFCESNKQFINFTCWGKVSKCEEINSCPAT